MIRVRFAPSPTGYLHIGNIRTALFNYLFAKHEGGKFFLRIEDTDRERSRMEYEEAIREDLRWLGLDWDETPIRQSERTAYYHEVLERLKKSGHVYPCFCPQGELEQKRKKALDEKRPPRYDGTCRDLSEDEVNQKVREGTAFSYRFRISSPLVEFKDLIKGGVAVNLNEMLGDFVVARQDGTPLFHLTVCADDIAMKITHVIRGEDHLSNTPRHILILRALGAAVPEFAHLPLILGEDGHPLSKRLGDLSIREFRAQGFPPEGVINYLALLGWSPGENRELMSRSEMAALFELGKVNSSPARFNHEKMRWVLHAHFQKVAGPELARQAGRFIRPESISLYTAPELEERLVYLRENAAGYRELAKQFESIFGVKTESDPGRDYSELPKDTPFPQILGSVKAVVEKTPGNYLPALDEFLSALKPLGLKGPRLFKPLRLILTGALQGPELKTLLPLLSKKLALQGIGKLEKYVFPGTAPENK